MKIICIAASRVPSDTANSIQVMKVCQALAQLGHEVALLVPGNPQSNIGNQQLATHYGLTTRFDIRWLSAPARLLFPWAAVHQARRLGADLLYVWPLQTAVLGLRARLPVILEMHDLPTGRLGPFWYRSFLNTSGQKRLLLITRALQNALDKLYGTPFPPEDVVIAPNGVDLERFASLPDSGAARRQLDLPTVPTIACTGHLYTGRGVDLFLALAAKFPQAHFLWVGGRPQDIDKWKVHTAVQGLQNVTFTGFVPNEHLPLYQAAADILLMPYGRDIAISSGMGHSAEISSPMKMFEYMAAGRAVITSDLPIIREVLNEDNAVFCPPEDIVAWESALDGLLRDSKRRQTLGRRARSDVAQYTWVARAQHSLAGFGQLC